MSSSSRSFFTLYTSNLGDGSVRMAGSPLGIRYVHAH